MPCDAWIHDCAKNSCEKKPGQEEKFSNEGFGMSEGTLTDETQVQSGSFKSTNPSESSSMELLQISCALETAANNSNAVSLDLVTQC